MNYFAQIGDHLKQQAAANPDSDLRGVLLRYRAKGKSAVLKWNPFLHAYTAHMGAAVYSSLSQLGAAWSKSWHSTRHHGQVELSFCDKHCKCEQRWIKSCSHQWKKWDDFCGSWYTPPDTLTDWRAFAQALLELDPGPKTLRKVVTAIKKADPQHTFSQNDVDLLATLYNKK